MWTNKETFAVQDGLEGLTDKQTKLASYWNTPFNKICLGMKVKNVQNWITIPYNATSFFDLISDGVYKNVNTGKKTWQSLINGSSLQSNCNKKGFNVVSPEADFGSSLKVRLGILANNQNDCNSCDSCIGFGITARGCNTNGLVDPIIDRNTTCGNLAICSKLGNMDIPAFGYILVQ